MTLSAGPLPLPSRLSGRRPQEQDEPLRRAQAEGRRRRARQLLPSRRKRPRQQNCLRQPPGDDVIKHFFSVIYDFSK
jgi:hypothetical protein